jgi:hypothetical protein
MTKISPLRKGALLAALSFAAALASGLVATPATAQSAPSTQGAVNGTASVRTVAASEFETSTLAGCPDLRGCVYAGANYTGTEVVRQPLDEPGRWALPINGLSYHSAKNHFDNRRLQVGHMRADGSIVVVRCLNPNTERPGPFPDGAELVRVGVLGSRC